METVTRAVRLTPSVAGALAGCVAVLLCLGQAWSLAAAGGAGAWMAAAGVAFVVGPLAGLAMALANYGGWLLVLWPVRWGLTRRVQAQAEAA